MFGNIYSQGVLYERAELDDLGIISNRNKTHSLVHKLNRTIDYKIDKVNTKHDGVLKWTRNCSNMESSRFGVIKRIYNTIVHNYEDLDGENYKKDGKCLLASSDLCC